MEASWQDGCFTLKNRLKIAYMSEFMCDMFFIVGKKKEKVPAHRLIMSTASHKLARMVKKFTPNSNNNTIEVLNTTPAVFRVFLEYLYTGEILDNHLDMVVMLYVWELAKQFSVKILKDLCRNYLSQMLTPDEANKCLEHSEALGNRVAVEICQRVIAEGEEQHFCNKKLDFCELLQSEKFSKMAVGHKFITICIDDEEIMNDCEMQFQPNERIAVAGFGVFARENSNGVGVLSIERLDVTKWDWVDHQFIVDFSILARCDIEGNEVVFFRINPPIYAEKKATYRLIFREMNCLYQITGQQNIKENTLIDFRTKYEQYSKNSMPFLLYVGQKNQRGVLKEINDNEQC